MFRCRVTPLSFACRARGTWGRVAHACVRNSAFAKLTENPSPLFCACRIADINACLIPSRPPDARAVHLGYVANRQDYPKLPLRSLQVPLAGAQNYSIAVATGSAGLRSSHVCPHM